MMANGSWRADHLRSNGFRQFYRDWRPRDVSSLPVLALHGSLTQSGMWTVIAETMASVRVVCPDQRGFGQSEDPGTDSCAEFAADALALAQTLSLDHYVVMGHSFACSIALKVAAMASQRVAAVVLVDPVVRIDPAGQTASPMSPPDSFPTMGEAARHFRETEEGKWTEQALKRFVQDIMIRDAQTGHLRFPYSPARLSRLRAFTASPASDYDLFTNAKTTHCPVLIFRGGMSKRFPPTAERPFRDAFTARPKIVVCPDSGHFPTAAEPVIIVNELKHFLDEIADN
jgi:pimeloyl-ACP methyl ester carboxylesterase